METIVCHRYPITGLEHILINSGARVRIVVLGFEKSLEQTRVNTGSRSAVNRAVSDLHWSSRELVGCIVRRVTGSVHGYRSPVV